MPELNWIKIACEGCQGGDKWPIDKAQWVCPMCDAEYSDDKENY